MKKKIGVMIGIFCFLGVFSLGCLGAQTSQSREPTEQIKENWLLPVFHMLDGETRELLKQAGIDEDKQLFGLTQLSPELIIRLLPQLFSVQLRDSLSEFLLIFSVLPILCLMNGALGDSAVKKTALLTGNTVLLFLLVSYSCSLFTEVKAEIELSEDFMLSLLPVYTGLLAFSQKPTAALGFQTVILGFAEGISVTICNLLPFAATVQLALSTASSLSGEETVGKIGDTVSSLGVKLLGLSAAVFTAVLTVRNVISAAADGVVSKGLKFLIGGSVPYVGGAISEAFTTVISALSLACKGVGILGIAGLFALNVPVLIKIAVWQLFLLVCELTGSLLGLKAQMSVIGDMKNVFKLLSAVLYFHLFIYTVSVAVIGC